MKKSPQGKETFSNRQFGLISIMAAVIGAVLMFSNSFSLVPPRAQSIPEAVGNLYVTMHPDFPVKRTQSLAGTQTHPLMVLNMRADDIEDIAVEYVRFGARKASSLDTVLLSKNEDGSDPFATLTRAACEEEPGDDRVAYYCAQVSPPMKIKADTTEVVYLSADLHTDEAGAVSKEWLRFWLWGRGYSPITAEGMNSNQVLRYNDHDGLAEGETFIGTDVPGEGETIKGEYNQVFLSHLEDILNTNPDADGTAVPKGLARIAQFGFIARENFNSDNGFNMVGLRDFAFEIDANNVELEASSVNISRTELQDVSRRCAVYQARTGKFIKDGPVTGDLFAVCRKLTDYINAFVGTGDQTDLEITAEITNPQISAGDSSLRVGINTYTNHRRTGFGFKPGANRLRWMDVDTATTSYSSWLDIPTEERWSTWYGDDSGSDHGGDGGEDGPNDVCGDGKITGSEMCDDGNTDNDDGCNALCEVESGWSCTGEPSECRRIVGQLFINHIDDQAEDKAVKNGKNKRLMRFESVAEEEDILMTVSKFRAAEGHLYNVQNYALWFDKDEDGEPETILQDGVAAQDGLVVFDDLPGGGIVIPDGEVMRFEVRGDVASSLQDDASLKLEFATRTDYIGAETLSAGAPLSGIETDSACDNAVSCDIHVVTGDSTWWQFVSQGNLYVMPDTTPVRDHQHLLGGTTNDHSVLNIELTADTEDIAVQFMTFAAAESDSIDRLDIYGESGDEPIAEATRGVCDVAGPDQYDIFCVNFVSGSSRGLIVENGGQRELKVMPQVKSDTQGGVSGEDVHFHVLAATEAVIAVGDESSNELPRNNADGEATGEIFVNPNAGGHDDDIDGAANTKVVMSKLESITDANPDPDYSAIPNGWYPIGIYKLTAMNHSNSEDGNNDVVPNKLTFRVQHTNVMMEGNYNFFNMLDQSTKVECYVSGGGGGPGNDISFVTCADISATISSAIDRGESATFALEAEILDAAPGSSQLQASLQTYSTQPSSPNHEWRDADQSVDEAFHSFDLDEIEISSTMYGDGGGGDDGEPDGDEDGDDNGEDAGDFGGPGEFSGGGDDDEPDGSGGIGGTGPGGGDFG